MNRSATVLIALTTISLGVLAAAPAWAEDAPLAGDVACATALSDRPPAIPLADSDLERALRGGKRLGSFQVVIVPGPTLAGNAPALAAFQRAADQWEAYFSDPITVTIDADLANLGGGGVIGSTAAVYLSGSYSSVRAVLAADAAGETDDGVVDSLPAAGSLPPDFPDSFTWSGSVQATKANLKAMGFTGLDAMFGTSDGDILFNTMFTFDYDNSNGVSGGSYDFETIAAHEIGHLLGFDSLVDAVDYLKDQGTTTGAIPVSPLDLFRFRRAAPDNPASTSDFSSFFRSMRYATDDITDDLVTERRMSTGTYNGDGRQTSHWKDNSLTGVLLGLMDPTYSSPSVHVVGAADVRALDLVGYDFEPCGDGDVDPGETCDDGNLDDGDCCSSDCVAATNGDPCDDGEFCNGTDTCAAAACTVHAGDPCSGGGECNDGCDEGGETCALPPGTPCTPDGAACSEDVCDGAGNCGVLDHGACDDATVCTSDSCEYGVGCVNAEEPADESSCLLGSKAKFQVQLGSDPSKNKLKWQLKNGDLLTQADLGNPAVDTSYTLCVYDTAASVSSLVTSVEIAPSGAFWTSLDPKGFKYKDKTASSDGVNVALFKTGGFGKSLAKISAKGDQLDLPAPVGATYLSQDPSVVAQLFNAEGVCWSTSFNAAVTKKHDESSFKAGF